MSTDAHPIPPVAPDRRGVRLLRVLRTVPVVAVFVCIAGVVLTVVAFSPPSRPVRTDGFAVLPERSRAALTELCRMWWWGGRSVRWQVEHGRIPDPATAWATDFGGGLP